jgi:hypothetical protein
MMKAKRAGELGITLVRFSSAYFKVPRAIPAMRSLLFSFSGPRYTVHSVSDILPVPVPDTD